METSKSPLTVAQEALKAGQENLADYRHPRSPHKFTQPQLFACLVVKEFQRLDYRGIWILLREWSELRKVLGLQKVPHFTTLCTAAKRLLNKPTADALLDGVLERCRQTKILGKRTPVAAIDSTGLETRHVSTYYTKRCQRHKGHRKSRYPKLTVVGDTANHLILGCGIDRGPQPDLVEARPTVTETVSHQPLEALLGDPGYEGEGFHQFCREDLGIRSVIPTTDRGRPRADDQPHSVQGHYRKLMQQHFPAVLYGQRWQAETLFREVKITLSADVLRSQSPQGIRKEVAARLTALNLVRILMLEAAATAQIEDPLRISFVHAVRAILSFSPALGRAPLVAVPGIYHALLMEIAAHVNPEHPGRLEPHAIRREHKHYPSLRVTRALWKARHHVA